MDDKSRTAASKFLSYVLRHEPAAVGIALDSGGWVAVDVLLHAYAQHGRRLSRAVDTHVDRGGPNGGATLWQARTNFLRFGACEEVTKQHARRPTPDEPRVRHWSLLEGVAVELIPATDVSPWNLCHDGTVAGLKRVGERVAMTVDIPYLRTRFDVPGVGFVFELLGGPEMEYAPYEGDAITSLDEIAKAEPDIVGAKEEDGRVVVWGSAGVLRLCYRDLTLRFNNGAPLALAALDECARAYWDEWERGHQRPAPEGEDQ